MQNLKSLGMAVAVVGAIVVAFPSSAAMMTSSQMATKPPAKNTSAISLPCSATAGDVAQTITITNSTRLIFAKGTKIYWTLNKSKGVKVLDSPISETMTVAVLGPPGNGGACTASVTPK